MIEEEQNLNEEVNDENPELERNEEENIDQLESEELEQEEETQELTGTKKK